MVSLGLVFMVSRLISVNCHLSLVICGTETARGPQKANCSLRRKAGKNSGQPGKIFQNSWPPSEMACRGGPVWRVRMMARWGSTCLILRSLSPRGFVLGCPASVLPLSSSCSSFSPRSGSATRMRAKPPRVLSCWNIQALDRPNSSSFWWCCSSCLAIGCRE